MTETPDVCEKCGRVWEIGMWATCKGNPDDHGKSIRHQPSEPFEVDLGKLGKHKITSLQDADRVQRYAAEHGQEISFRVYNQNPGNYRDNSMGENKQIPFSTRDRRGNSRVRRHRP